MLSEFANNELFEMHGLAEAQKTQKQANSHLESSLYLSELVTHEGLSILKSICSTWFTSVQETHIAQCSGIGT